MVHDALESPESILIGGPIQDNDDLCALVNPIIFIDESVPPFLIVHGDADPLVPHCQSVFLHKALIKNGVVNEMITVPVGGHGDGVWIDKYIDRMVKFFKKAKNQKLYNN